MGVSSLCPFSLFSCGSIALGVTLYHSSWIWQQLEEGPHSSFLQVEHTGFLLITHVTSSDHGLWYMKYTFSRSNFFPKLYF